MTHTLTRGQANFLNMPHLAYAEVTVTETGDVYLGRSFIGTLPIWGAS